MKTYVGINIWDHVFLTLVLVGSEWSASLLVRFTPGEIAPSTPWMGVWVAPDNDLKSDLSVVQPIASHYTNFTIPAYFNGILHYKNVQQILYNNILIFVTK
jgi:hypothetical protein